MQVQINDNEIEIPSGIGLRVGELLEALSAHIEPGEILSQVRLDGESFTLSDKELASRSVEETSTLSLTTVPGQMLGETEAALTVVGADVCGALALLDSGDVAGARSVLVGLLDDLALVLLEEEGGAGDAASRSCACESFAANARRLEEAEAVAQDDAAEGRIGPILQNLRRGQSGLR